MNTSTNTVTSALTTSRAAQLGREARRDPNVYIPAWDGSPGARLIEDAEGLTMLSASEVIDGGHSVGTHLEIPLEAFEELGLHVSAEDGAFQLTGSHEEIAKAAALFAEAGTKLQSYLNSLPKVEAVEDATRADDSDTDAIVLHYVPKNRSASTVRTLCGEAWNAEEPQLMGEGGLTAADTVICHRCLDAHLRLQK